MGLLNGKTELADINR